MNCFKYSFSVLLLMCMLVFISGSYIERLKLDPQPHREDYAYAKALNAFFKVHRLPQTWNSARAKCQAEGATLMWFHNEDEFQGIRNELPMVYTELMFLGIHSKFSKDIFVTLAGLRIEDVYNNWPKFQPDNAADNVDCVGISREGVMYVIHCNNYKRSYMCRRDYNGNINHLYNNCRTYDKAYIYEKTLDRCYKVHTEPKNWTDAFTICAAEGSYLAVINSREESQLLLKLTKNADVYGTYWADKKQFLLGFHDMFAEGEYRTIFGETLTEAGFDQFEPGQPNNYGEQNCGALTIKGNINDIWCTKPFPFICERELSVALDVQ